MTIVLLVRHGLTDYNTSRRVAGRTPGVSLNSEGKAQAAAAAQRLAKLPIKAVYASPMERTVETAQAIAAALGLSVIVQPGLIETDTGEWTGRLFQDVQTDDAAIWQAVQSHPRTTRMPGGETMDEIQARMVGAIEAICRDHPDNMVAAVSHADPIKTAIAHYIGLDLNKMQKLSISPTSVSMLSLGEHGSHLIVMNHLGALPDPTVRH